MKRIWQYIAAAFVFGIFTQFANIRPAAAAPTCSVATSANKHVLCWFDLTTYTPTPGVATPITFTLPDGSSYSTTLTTTGPSIPAASAFPTWTGSALGHTTYLGVTGEPAIYGGGTFSTQFSNIKLTDPQGIQLPNVMMIMADAESLDTGDGTNANLIWTTAGTPWTQLEVMESLSDTLTPICALTGLGTTIATCVPTSGANEAAYILESLVTPTQSVNMATTTQALQGYAFAVNLAKLTVSKTISTRINTTDQFQVAISRAGGKLVAASTSGTATTATTSLVVTPTDTYTFTDSAATGSAPNLNLYAEQISCINAVPSSTVLPSGYGTSFSVTPAVDDQISCTFTNAPLKLTNVAATPTQTIMTEGLATDNFVLTNTTAVPATFVLGAPTLTASASGTLHPSGYSFNGTDYTTLASVQAAITAAGPTPANGTLTIGVLYTGPAAGQTVVVSESATATDATSSSTAATATETDTIVPNATGLNIVKTGPSGAAPGGLIAYTIVVSNTALNANTGYTFYDQMPTGLTITGTPTCGNATGGAVCGTLNSANNIVTDAITSLPKNSSLTFTIYTVAGTASSYTNTGVLLSPTVTVTSAVTTTIGQTSGLNKTVRNLSKGETSGQLTDTAAPGDTLQYGLTFTNTANASIKTPVITDTLPATVTFASASCGTLPAGIISCTISSPSIGTTGTVTLTYTGTLANNGALAATINVLVK